jgi:hypothetical protein
MHELCKSVCSHLICIMEGLQGGWGGVEAGVRVPSQVCVYLEGGKSLYTLWGELPFPYPWLILRVLILCLACCLSLFRHPHLQGSHRAGARRPLLASRADLASLNLTAAPPRTDSFPCEVPEVIISPASVLLRRWTSLSAVWNCNSCCECLFLWLCRK